MYIKVVEAEYINSLDRAYEDGFKKGKDSNKDNQNLNYRMGFNDGWHDCEASFELGNEFTDSIQEQAYDEGFVEGYNQHEYEVHQVMPESSCKSLRELSEQEFESIIDEAFEEGYAQAYNEIQTKTERERALQEKAWDEGYSQAISDVIDEDFEGDYSEEYYSEESYSEYKFGDVEDDEGDGEEDYCFSKELDKILNGEFTSNINFDGNNKEEMVNHPKHYNSDLSGVECIEVARYRNFNVGSALKYLWRCGLKNGNSDIQDLEKAVWYLNDEIKSLKRGR